MRSIGIRSRLWQQSQGGKSDGAHTAIPSPGNCRNDLSSTLLPRGLILRGPVREDLDAPEKIVCLSGAASYGRIVGNLCLGQQRLRKYARRSFIAAFVRAIEALQKDCQQYTKRDAENCQRDQHFDQRETCLALGCRSDTSWRVRNLRVRSFCEGGLAACDRGARRLDDPHTHATSWLREVFRRSLPSPDGRHSCTDRTRRHACPGICNYMDDPTDRKASCSS